MGVAGVTASPLPGPAGNVEYFLWLRRGAAPLDPARLEAAVADGTVVTTGDVLVRRAHRPGRGAEGACGPRPRGSRRPA